MCTKRTPLRTGEAAHGAPPCQRPTADCCVLLPLLLVLGYSHVHQADDEKIRYGYLCWCFELPAHL